VEHLASALDILLIILGAIGFYEARSFSAIQKILSRLGFLKRYIFRSRTVTIIENKPTGERDRRSATATGLIAITPAPRPAGTVVGAAQSLLFWLALPFDQIIRAATVCSDSLCRGPRLSCQ
jgi:hypothetical protein